jgi:hypothetical protein
MGQVFLKSLGRPLTGEIACLMMYLPKPGRNLLTGTRDKMDSRIFVTPVINACGRYMYASRWPELPEVRAASNLSELWISSN